MATQWVLGDLAWNLEQLGDLGNSAKRYRELAEGRLVTLGAEAPDTVWALTGLARVLAGAESHAAALEAYRVLYEAQVGIVGPEGDEALTALEAYTWELGKVGELEKARARWQELANAYERN